MAVLLITYDLNKEKTKKDYEGFYNLIKSVPWARLSESSYAIETTATPQYVFNQLKPYIDSNDHVEVITLTSPYWGQHDPVVMKWLRDRL